MRTRDNLRVAFRALRVNSMRSALTMLGIVIGVAAVITMVAVGSGAETQVAERIRSLGANVLLVIPGAQNTGGTRLGSGTRHTLTEDDAAAIATAVSSIQAAAPAMSRTAQVIRGNRNWATTVAGITNDYLLVREWEIGAGRGFTSEEIAAADKVAIVGATVLEHLFGAPDVMGQELRINNVPFTVIGTLSRKGQSPTGRDQDDVVFIPLTTAKTRVLGRTHEVNRHAVDLILVKVTGAALMGEAEQDVRRLLRERHRRIGDAPDDFTVRNAAEIQEARQQAARTLTLLLAAVAAVSLIVGGISIMNIMLVSVTERTREIGLRLALGAAQHHVRNQFLVEAVTLAVLGGVAGTALGIGAAVAIAEMAGWPILIAPGAILLAVGSAAAVGIFFGWYPALKASRLDPIEALRFE
jgi:putative ABC transport system permease protein